MNAAAIHAVLARRLTFLHEAFLDATTDVRPTQFEQPVASCNHANWLIGHHLWEKDILLVQWPDGDSLLPRDLAPLYGFGSTPQGPEACPDTDWLRDTIGELHAPMLARLTPQNLLDRGEAAPDVLPTRLDCALHFLHDASYHLGQLSSLRKLLADRRTGESGKPHE